MAPTGSGEITPRDLQVVKWIARGEERNGAAEILGLSRQAINRHMAKVMKLTGSRSSTQAVAVLMATGVLDAETATGCAPATLSAIRKNIAPSFPEKESLPTVKRIEVAALLRSNKPLHPEGVEAEETLCEVLESLAAEIERGDARIPIPNSRRDPDAPRPPQQPKRDGR